MCDRGNRLEHSIHKIEEALNLVTTSEEELGELTFSTEQAKSFEIIRIFLEGFFECGRILENGFSFSSNGSKAENRTVPCKCKLTVPRNSNFETRSSILETRKLRLLRLESSASSIESSASSFETGKQRTFHVISFSHVLSEATVSSVPSLQRCDFVGVMRARVCSSWKEFALQAFC